MLQLFSKVTFCDVITNHVGLDPIHAPVSAWCGIAVYALISQACLQSLKMLLSGKAGRLWWFMNELAWLLWAHCIYLSQASSLMGGALGRLRRYVTATLQLTETFTMRAARAEVHPFRTDLRRGLQGCTSFMRPPSRNTLMLFSCACLHSQQLTWRANRSGFQPVCFCIFNHF